MAKYLSFFILCMTFIFPFQGHAQKSFKEVELLYACGRFTAHKQKDEVHTTHFMKGFHLNKGRLNFRKYELYRSVDRVLLRHIEKNCKLKKIKGEASLQKLHASFDELCLSQCKITYAKAISDLGLSGLLSPGRVKSFKNECPQMCRFAKKEHSQLVKEFKKAKLEELETEQPTSVDH